MWRISLLWWITWLWWISIFTVAWLGCIPLVRIYKFEKSNSLIHIDDRQQYLKFAIPVVCFALQVCLVSALHLTICANTCNVYVGQQIIFTHCNPRKQVITSWHQRLNALIQALASKKRSLCKSFQILIMISEIVLQRLSYKLATCQNKNLEKGTYNNLLRHQINRSVHTPRLHLIISRKLFYHLMWYDGKNNTNSRFKKLNWLNANLTNPFRTGLINAHTSLNKKYS